MFKTVCPVNLHNLKSSEPDPKIIKKKNEVKLNIFGYSIRP